VIPVYNSEKYLLECLVSLIEQPQGCSFEVILVDDGSTDSSSLIATDFVPRAAAQGVALRIVSLEHVGLIRALEAGIEVATCELIARMDSDDICLPGRLARQRDFLLANPHLTLVGGQALLLNMDNAAKKMSTAAAAAAAAAGGAGEEEKLPTVMTLAAGIPTHPTILHWSMLFKCPLLHPTVMFRKTKVRACGSYAAALGTDRESIEDYDLWSRVAHCLPMTMANVPDVVLLLRRHRDSKSAAQQSMLRQASRQVQWVAISALMETPTKDATEAAEADLGIEEERLFDIVQGRSEPSCREDVIAAFALLQRIYNRFCAKHLPPAPSPLSSSLSSSSVSAFENDGDDAVRALHALLLASRQRLERNILRAGLAKRFELPQEMLHSLTSTTQANALKDLVVVASSAEK